MAKKVKHFISVKTNYGDTVLIPAETVFKWLKDERERVVAHFQLNYMCLNMYQGSDHVCDGWKSECEDPNEFGWEPKPTYWDLEAAIMNPMV